MPYRRSSRRKSKRTKRSRWQIYGSAASQLWKDVNYLKSVVNVEKKYLDVLSTGTAISSTPTLVLMNALATGTDSTDREGDSVKFISEFIRFKYNFNSSATATTIRSILFIDRQTNGAAPTAGSLLESSSNIMSPLSITYGKRFKVLFDHYTMLCSNYPEKVFKFYKKTNFHTRYGANTAAITSIATNSVYLLLMSDEATNTPNVEYYNRMRFIDN